MSNEKKIDTMVRYSPLKIPSLIWGSWKAEGKPSLNFMAEPSTVKSELTAQTARSIAESESREFIDWNHSDLSLKKEIQQSPSKYFVFADFRASETDIGELRLQNMGNDELYITFKYNLLFDTLSKSDAMGVLFFDEMNNAPGLVKAQFYKVLNDKAIGDIPLSKNVLCICAGNEAKHSRIVSKDSEPLVLRRGNFFLRPLTNEEFLDYAIASGMNKWIVGYLAFQKGDTHKIEYDLPDGVGQPCPRTWTRLGSILDTDKNMPLDDVEMFSTGWVGQGVAKKFSAYVKSAQDIDLAKILENPASIANYERDAELSLLYAIVSGLIDTYRENKKALPKIIAVANNMNRVEIGTFFMRGIKYVDEKSFIRNMTNIDSVTMDAFVQKYGKFLVK